MRGGALRDAPGDEGRFGGLFGRLGGGATPEASTVGDLRAWPVDGGEGVERGLLAVDGGGGRGRGPGYYGEDGVVWFTLFPGSTGDGDLTAVSFTSTPTAVAAAGLLHGAFPGAFPGLPGRRGNALCRTRSGGSLELLRLRCIASMLKRSFTSHSSSPPSVVPSKREAVIGPDTGPCPGLPGLAPSGTGSHCFVKSPPSGATLFPGCSPDAPSASSPLCDRIRPIAPSKSLGFVPLPLRRISPSIMSRSAAASLDSFGSSSLRVTVGAASMETPEARGLSSAWPWL